MFFVTTSIVCAELVRRAELDHVGPGEEDRRVTRADVVGVARLKDLLVSPERKATLPLITSPCARTGTRRSGPVKNGERSASWV